MKKPKNPLGGLPEWVLAARIQNSKAERLRREAGTPAHQISAARPALKFKLRPGDAELIDRFVELIRLAKPTPWAIQGILIAALRESDCLKGAAFHRADYIAREIVARAYKRSGARTPTPDEGQRYYTRTNCAYCHGYLDGSTSGIFCSDEHAILAKARNFSEEAFSQLEWNRQAHRAIARQKIEPRRCAAPDCVRQFIPRTPKARLCPEHQNSERVTAIPKKPCATCGEPFRGKTRDAQYCSRKCNPVTHRKLEDRACANKSCGRFFRPRNAEQVYCSMPCYREGSRGPRLNTYGIAA